MEHTSSFDICARHGGILALGEVIHALYLSHEGSSEKYTPSGDLLSRKCNSFLYMVCGSHISNCLIFFSLVEGLYFLF